MTTITTGSTPWTATIDHRTGVTLTGGPASRYLRVARCDGRHAGVRPNYAARRLGALFVVLSSIMAGAWLLGEVAASVAGQPASAATDTESTGSEPQHGLESLAPDIHVARDGDTLWSIADEYRGDVGRERFVDALVVLNGGTSLDIGQAVHLP